MSWIFWVLLSITLHELAHGWAAIWEGDKTPIETGHMSANPVVHMGRFSLIVFALIGFAWGLMPVRPWRFRHGRLGEAIVAIAGPAMNLALA
ncbi:MAG: site-2 protease family protein, partial [Phycisphaerae bacterium]|nr:site-2 protease family protein [Phycisphaerae bacterium]